MGGLFSYLLKITTKLTKCCWRCLPDIAPKGADLVSFEFGLSYIYLIWRGACLFLISMMMLALYWGPPELHLNEILCMHAWLALLLLLGLTIETLALIVTLLCCISNHVLEQSPTFRLRMVWYQYDAIYPNIFSCYIMYNFVLEYEHSSERIYIFQFLITVNALIHVLTTKIPSHPCHVFAPLVLTLLYVVFNYVWYKMRTIGFPDLGIPGILNPETTTSSSPTPAGVDPVMGIPNKLRAVMQERNTSSLLEELVADVLPTQQERSQNVTNAFHHTESLTFNFASLLKVSENINERQLAVLPSKYWSPFNSTSAIIYEKMDWRDSPGSAKLFAILWLLVTVACYAFMVLVSYIRPKVFVVDEEDDDDDDDDDDEFDDPTWHSRPEYIQDDRMGAYGPNRMSPKNVPQRQRSPTYNQGNHHFPGSGDDVGEKYKIRNGLRDGGYPEQPSQKYY